MGRGVIIINNFPLHPARTRPIIDLPKCIIRFSASFYATSSLAPSVDTTLLQHSTTIFLSIWLVYTRLLDLILLSIIIMTQQVRSYLRLQNKWRPWYYAVKPFSKGDISVFSGRSSIFFIKVYAFIFYPSESKVKKVIIIRWYKNDD